jgi:hypothetical protein
MLQRCVDVVYKKAQERKECMMKPELAQFTKTEVLHLETFRRSDARIATPMWFVENGDVRVFNQE